MPVRLDADRAVVGESHAEDRITGPAPLGQCDGDGVFGDRRVIGDGDVAGVRRVGQGADRARRKLPRGGGRGEEKEGEDGAHEGDVGGSQRRASNARWVERAAGPGSHGITR